ncbi:hypothetical protein OSTOST_11859, partial [Ostertagia ostertagi]
MPRLTHAPVSPASHQTSICLDAREVREALKPIYAELEKNITERNMEAIFKHLHTDCVVVQKNKEEIGAKMKKFLEEHQPKNLKRSNATYCGCECCICVSVEVGFDTPKGPAKVVEHHIWKKQ